MRISDWSSDVCSSDLITTAGQIAMHRGAKVSHIPDFEGGLRILRNGPGADLVMIDVRQPVARFMKQMKQERMNTPVVACGIQSDPETAVAAIRAGAEEYIPLPPNQIGRAHV